MLMSMKRMGAALTATMMLVTLAACGQPEHEDVDRDIDSGIVIKTDRKHVTVLEDDNEKDIHTVSKLVARKCSVGKRWPDCKK